MITSFLTTVWYSKNYIFLTLSLLVLFWDHTRRAGELYLDQFSVVILWECLGDQEVWKDWTLDSRVLSMCSKLGAISCHLYSLFYFREEVSWSAQGPCLAGIRAALRDHDVVLGFESWSLWPLYYHSGLYTLIFIPKTVHISSYTLRASRQCRWKVQTKHPIEAMKQTG